MDAHTILNDRLTASSRTAGAPRENKPRSSTMSAINPLHIRSRYGSSTKHNFSMNQAPLHINSSSTTGSGTSTAAHHHHHHRPFRRGTAPAKTGGSDPDTANNSDAGPSGERRRHTTRTHPNTGDGNTSATGAAGTSTRSGGTAKWESYPPQCRLLPDPLRAEGGATRSTVTTQQRANTAAASQLTARLSELNGAAHAETRRLDEAYYALLSRTAQLQGLVSSLRGLHAELDRGRVRFRGGTTELGAKVDALVAGHDGFGAQRARLEALGGRLRESRRRAERAEGRLEGLRVRVEGWERDEESRGKERQKVFGAVAFGICALIALVIALLVAKEWRTTPERVVPDVDDSTSRLTLNPIFTFDQTSGQHDQARGSRWDEIFRQLEYSPA